MTNIQSRNPKENLTKIAGAGIGAGIGCIAGSKISEKVAGKLISKTCMSSDEYLSSRIAANRENIYNTVRKSKQIDAFKKIAEKASTDYKKFVSEFTSYMKGKGKIIGAVVAGTIGLICASKLVKKAKSQTKES